MFGFLKKEFKLVAPVSGKVIDLSEVPDPVFSQKMAGDGVGIDSTSDVVVAPADGVISIIFKTNHAFGMLLNNGVELLVHIGIDTVELDGAGFERLIQEGSKVKAGMPVIKIDRNLIKDKGYSLITPVLITNPDNLKELKYDIDMLVQAGKEAVVTYKTK
ncbi:PTS glucose transporter subunit IIA [Clostridium sp. A1-XYC3]|uniref:PTS glucose transporter subunit IIA n=1 Tax=Clostridium tanneri TaxID=3037988 RepID=A0ABU4JVY4_9CLOT|nr:PTS glucose transporter subunit IIA [Clostridium sp. A1-XYC3]MDW8802309.1 PTS glucose transporter subunit IIA [Clostridium sp. A1-XYC3]